jgi:ferritin-like metal-binding protein YciE
MVVRHRRGEGCDAADKRRKFTADAQPPCLPPVRQAAIQARGDAGMKTINDACLSLLQDMYYAERQILKALPKMAKAAESEKLRQGFQQHREETEHHVERLQQVFEHMGKRARGQTCEAINGIIEEGEEFVGELDKGPVLDAALAANAQAVEHYEIARYGTLIAWFKVTGMNEPARLLEQTLEEEKKTDQLLNEVANAELNPKAAQTAKAA